MYTVQHRYFYDKDKKTGLYRKEGTVFLFATSTLADAEWRTRSIYLHRFMEGREYVEILDEHGDVIVKKGVDYMAQFEAVPGKVWTFASSSGSGQYKTQINSNGILSCNCKGWAIYKGRPRSCKHTDAVALKEHLDLEAKGQYLMLVNASLQKAKAKFAAAKTKPAERFAIYLAEYEAAINVMAALEPSKMYQAAAEVEVAKYRVESYLLLLEEHGIDGTPAFLAAEQKFQIVRANAR